MVVETNSGRAPLLRPYYAYWERELFAALTRMVLKALRDCLSQLSPREAGGGSPIFRVGAILAAPEILVSPPLGEVNKFLSKMVKSLVEGTRGFVRWMHGTCTETPAQVAAVVVARPGATAPWSRVHLRTVADESSPAHL